MGGDILFLLRSVEEGEGEDGDGCCALDVQESFVKERKFSRWSHRGRLVFMTRPSCQGG